MKVVLLVVLGLVMSAADNYLGRIKVIPAPTVFALVSIFLLVAKVLADDYRMRPRFKMTSEVLKKNGLVIIPFLLIVMASFLGAVYTDAYWKEGGKWIYLIAYSFIILLLAMFLPLIPFVRERFNLISGWALFLLVCSMIWDMFVPGTFSVEINRTSGFSGNSNWGALTAVMLCGGTLRMRASEGMMKDAWVFLFAGLGIFSTLSRSGMLNFFVLAMLYVFFTYFTRYGDARKGWQFIMYACIGGLIAMVVASVMLTQTEIFAKSKAQNRLLGFLSGDLVDDGSSSDRMGAVHHAIELVEESPVLGHGTGFSRTMPEKPHNLFLNQWVNNGLPGLLSYLLLLGGMITHFYKYRYDRGFLLVAAVFVGSFFSHNILEQRTFLLLLGMMTTLSWMDGNKIRYPYS